MRSKNAAVVYADNLVLFVKILFFINVEQGSFFCSDVKQKALFLFYLGKFKHLDFILKHIEHIAF